MKLIPLHEREKEFGLLQAREAFNDGDEPFYVPAAFRFTLESAAERHLRCAELMGVPVGDLDEAGQYQALPRALLSLM